MADGGVADGGGADNDDDEAAGAAARSGGVRRSTMRIGAPQQLQRSVARSLIGGCGGGDGDDATLNTSNFSSAASRLALGCRKP